MTKTMPLFAPTSVPPPGICCHVVPSQWKRFIKLFRSQGLDVLSTAMRTPPPPTTCQSLILLFHLNTEWSLPVAPGSNGAGNECDAIEADGNIRSQDRSLAFPKIGRLV